MNITTDIEIPFIVGEAECKSMNVDLGIREYAVGVGLKKDGSMVKLIHERRLSDIYAETKRLENAQRNEDWRGVKHIHRRLESKRKHYNHNLACQLVRKSETVLIGDVASKFLFANPSSKIARKAADACHGQLRIFTAQKPARATAQRNVHLVREAYTSKTCGHCGVQNSIGALKFWTCHRCRTWHDSDVNAALNMRFCPIKEDLAAAWKKQRAQYEKMRMIRKRPRKKIITLSGEQ